MSLWVDGCLMYMEGFAKGVESVFDVVTRLGMHAEETRGRTSNLLAMTHLWAPDRDNTKVENP